MIEEHPVPQQITTYQFRLVGDMTLKQFFQVAGGCLIALLFYASNLPGFIKWPFIGIFVLAGIALAFLPIEDRPLEDWIVAFFRAIYMPTFYTWTKTSKLQKFFQDEAIPPKVVTDEGVIAPYGKKAMEEYLKTPADQQQKLISKLDSAEEQFLLNTMKLFKPEQVITDQQLPGFTPMENISIKPPIQTHKQVAQKPISIFAPQPVFPQVTQMQPSKMPSVFGIEPYSPQPTSSLLQKPATPAPPTIQNTVTGQILDENGKIVEGAILEIKDSAGRPVRALKSNKVGHFLTVTPLLNGIYQIITEKEGFVFQPLNFQAKGEIISPIIIRAKQSLMPNMTSNELNKPDLVSQTLKTFT